MTVNRVSAIIALSASVILAAAFMCGCSDQGGDKSAGTESVTATVYLSSAIPDGAQCAECGMYVEADGRFSGEAVSPDGEYSYFCDIGDLLIHLGKSGDSGDNEVSAAYVRDYNTGGWVSAFDANYLAGAPVRTPMRFGIAAFEKRPDAEAYRAENGGGTIYSYVGIQAEKPYK
jgi:copper chaperone NosL